MTASTRTYALLLSVFGLVGCRNEQKHENEAAPGLSASAAAKEPELTPEALVAMECLPCHDNLMLEQQRLTAKQWGNVVKKMQGWGSQIPAGSLDGVVAYLAKQYPADGAAYEVPRVSLTDVSTRFSSSPDGVFAGGDARRGETIFKGLCFACHGSDAKGTATGIAITDRPILQRPADFAEVVRKGRRRMPSNPTYGDSDIAALLAFLRERKPG